MADHAARAARALLALVALTAAVYLVVGGGKAPAPAPTQTQTTQTLTPLATRPPTAIAPSLRPTAPFILGKRVAFLGDSYTAGFGATPRTRGYAYLTSR
ncbi:MAG: hypothetical protein JWN31_2063, partial [Frankiales bacterium]|nr:hypothetical protein [Frankiales bacterium]